MPIPSYQIRNIISSYVNLLMRKNRACGPETYNFYEHIQSTGEKAHGKRSSLIEKVADEIIDKITGARASAPGFSASFDGSEFSGEKEREPARDQLEFAYYKIENGGEKRKFHFRLEKTILTRKRLAGENTESLP